MYSFLSTWSHRTKAAGYRVLCAILLPTGHSLSKIQQCKLGSLVLPSLRITWSASQVFLIASATTRNMKGLPVSAACSTVEDPTNNPSVLGPYFLSSNAFRSGTLSSFRNASTTSGFPVLMGAAMVDCKPGKSINQEVVCVWTRYHLSRTCAT